MNAALCYDAGMTYQQKITFGKQREAGDREVLVPEHHVTALLTELPPTRRQTRAAIAVVLIVIVAFAVVAPFSGRQAATLNAFFPSLDAIVLVTDLITAVLFRFPAHARSWCWLAAICSRHSSSFLMP